MVLGKSLEARDCPACDEDRPYNSACPRPHEKAPYVRGKAGLTKRPVVCPGESRIATGASTPDSGVAGRHDSVERETRRSTRAVRVVDKRVEQRKRRCPSPKSASRD